MNKPTSKQIDFAQAIGEELGIDPPFGGSKEDYSEFIEQNQREFYKERNKRRYESGDVFHLEHQYTLQDFTNEVLNKNPFAL